MSNLDDFKNLNLDREQLETCLNEFCSCNGASLEPLNESTDSKKIYKIIKAGMEPGRIVFYLRNDGTTTIQTSEGKNKEFNNKAAAYIKSKLCNSEISSLNMSISGVDDTTIKLILEEIDNIKDKNKIEVNTVDIKGGIQYQLKSRNFSDKLNLSYYNNTNRLCIQGRPLSCYKVVAYALSASIDTDTLARILFKKDEHDKIIVRAEVSENALKAKLPKSYDNLPKEIKNLLVSSYCVKSASPELPEYSMLTYCELRALEGLIKHTFRMNDVIEIPANVGEMFKCHESLIVLKEEVLSASNGLNKIKQKLENAYAYYRRRRHSLFHMETNIETTAKVNSLAEALNICDKVYELIEDFY